MSGNVFIAFQANDDTRPIIEAIEQDNPQARIQHMPAMVKIDAPGQLVICKETVETLLGRRWDLQEIHINLISISGNVDETDECFTVGWFR
ncbi:MmoB/DmpM family protein [Pseudomonas japonica]|uniref:MmoB/DmpM family protein n=1 Tax=Pseudomonas japonica TaxID=256466 RepID=UPI0037FB05AD